jgi:hypothetical protein
MKKMLWLVPLLALILIAAAAGSGAFRPMRLTVINKSSMALELSLMGTEEQNFYYLRIPEGSRDVPTEKVFTIIPDVYTSRIYFVELWDPVYGHSCTDESESLDIRRDVRVIVFECNRRPPNRGEPPSLVKYGAGRGKRGR